MDIILSPLKNNYFCRAIVFLSFVLLVILAGQHAMGKPSPFALVDNQSHSKTLQDFNFVVAGDFGCGGKAKKTISNMAIRDPELVLALGDLSYQKKPDCWFDLISRLDTNGKFKITFGEHDIDDNLTKYNQYIEHFNLSKPYYSFDYQNIHFLVMATSKNSVIPYLKGSEQYDFVNDDLRKASRNKSIDWIIVSTFRPFYSSNTTHPGLDKLQDAYHRLFEKYDVDIVLQGHNHNYQRTYPLLYNQTTQSTPIITDKSLDYYDKNSKGQIFVTVGTAGENLYNFTGQAPYVISQFMRYGFLNIDVTDSGSKLTGSFYENREMSNKDHFSISK